MSKDEEIPADVVPPQVEMAARAADLDMMVYTGSMFPQSYRGGIFSVGMLKTLVLALALAVCAGAAAAGDMRAGLRKAQVCMPCHGIDGVGRNPTVPNIAGESELYLTKQLKAFRSGERRHEQMSIIAKPLTDNDIANLSAWYSAIEFTVKLPN